MFPLADLPTELLLDICDFIPEAIPNLRGTCRRFAFDDRIFNQFGSVFFTRLPVHASWICLSTLLDISHHEQLRSFVQTIVVNMDYFLDTSFRKPRKMMQRLERDTAEFWSILVGVLGRLPSLTALLPWADGDQVLCRSQGGYIDLWEEHDEVSALLCVNLMHEAMAWMPFYPKNESLRHRALSTRQLEPLNVCPCAGRLGAQRASNENHSTAEM